MALMEHRYSSQQQPPLASAPDATGPFITITRQPGATAGDLGYRLADALSRASEEKEPWVCWDRELVQRIASECEVPDRVIQALDYAHHSWLDDLFQGMAMESHNKQDFLGIFHAAQRMIRGLGASGRAIIVGQGSAYLTRQLPGGIHIWLVAPGDWRVAHFADRQELDQRTAQRELRRRERNQAHFYRTLCNGQRLVPEFFSVTLNVASLSEQEMLEGILTLVRGRG